MAKGEKMKNVERDEIGNTKMYAKLTDAGEYEGILFRNTKSKFQPAYNLKENSGLVWNVRGYMSKQLRAIEDDVVNHRVRILVEKAHSNKYNKDFLKITRIEVYDTPLNQQTQIQIEHVKE